MTRLCFKPLFIGAFLCLFFASANAKEMAAVATAHPLATQAVERTLSKGGNAFDAAITATAALAVVEPYSSGIGGGGFWLLHRAKDNYEVMIDGRERAPLAATETMYQDEQGKVIPGLSLDGALAAGIPGVPAAMVHMAKKYGRLPLAQSLQPAIELAERGFEVDDFYRRMAGYRLKALQDSPAAAAIFLKDGALPPVGHVIKQTDLANTIRAIAEQGFDGFYRGAVAEKMLNSVKQAGGIWSVKDLTQYKIVEREPVRGVYRGMRITSAALPSSGGIVLVEILNILEGYDLANKTTAQQKHLVIEAMRRAYRDRAMYLGDPDFVKDMPLERMASKHYAAGLRASMLPDKATPSEQLPGKPDYAGQGTDTTHFSIMDKDGNRVSATLSINYPFGSGFVSEGTGVLLNDEMDDFSSKPGTPNVYGLIGAEANKIEPGKRMLSSMTPTFLETDDRVAVIGTPGGSRIITMVLLSALGFEQGKTAEELVAIPRFHHQYLPDVVQFEPAALSRDEELELQWLGHQLKQQENPYGNMQVVIKEKQSRKLSAASDPRVLGQAVVIQK